MSHVLALDFDGTLVGCRDRQLAALERAAAGRPLPDRDAFWAAKQRGASTAAALAALGIGDAEAIARRWVEVVEDDDLLPLDRPVADLREALALVGADAIAIVTARRRAPAVNAQIAALGLRPAAGVHVVPPADAAAAKARVLGALRAVGFVGDTESDAQAAATAGVPFAAVAGGQRDAAWLEQRVGAPVHASLRRAVGALVG